MGAGGVGPEEGRYLNLIPADASKTKRHLNMFIMVGKSWVSVLSELRV